jgi:hypothetical protein
MQNGRVNLSYDKHGENTIGLKGVPGFGFRTEVGNSEAADAIRGNVMATPMNQAYFSPANVQIIQNKLRREVFERSNGDFLIDPQSVDELMIVMRAMYYQYGKNQPTNIPGQIEELNQMVADWCIPKILAETSMHKTYLHDIQTLPVPMAHPILLTRTGTKSSTFDRFFS